MKKAVTLVMISLVLFAGFNSLLFAEDTVTIKTLFKLLPEKVLKPVFDNFNLDTARRDSYIEVCDDENRYLSLKSEYGFEMCYWDVKGGKKLILVSYGGAGPEVFYLYNKGKFSETNDFGIKAIKEQVKKSPALEGMNDLIRFYPLRDNTSLAVMINQLDCMIFKWKNEKFVRINDYVLKETDDESDIYNILLSGFVKALNAHDAAFCLQYIKPDYIAFQCMDMLQGRTEQFICELIAGQNEDSEYIEPHSLKDIKKASYSLNDEFGFIITIELIDGRTYTYFPMIEGFEEAEIYGLPIQYLYLVGARG
ncbi:hypothetical protein [Treponema putidum]|uniref:DUF3298 domain-containing protein n=1 Tax=Treponema putidum TaxID=221027 RepID=A0AAE9MT28_9SPIR|nr:hypothetical protein [Treponema putidum]AIN93008.1 hypothetical protein JO40_01790 [Treponema putidum]TWI78481.1 hypothetical protein JM98_00602 [Treponema putidum]UTY29252.1 hypothetical protein E4N76_09950 [Treponema putidum]UTY31657.1 hypothetical protein E4N75_09340 [Treponema putidum]UTY34109.1 hypothetical protein E4N74_08895 [Treponema putidum]